MGVNWEVGEGHSPGPLGGMEEVFFLCNLLSPPPQPPTPPLHSRTPPHQEQGLFVGLWKVSQ